MEAALAIACKNGSTEIVSDLLQNGVSPDSLDQRGFSALFVAAHHGHTEIVELLLRYGARDQKVRGLSALMMAKKTEIVQLLLEHGVQVDSQDYDGKTALLSASKEGNTKKIKLLLEKNAKIDMQDNNGLTALIQACCHGNTKAVKMLLEHGAQVDLTEKFFHQTALILASFVNQIKIVQLLLDHGAQVNWKDRNGKTALMHVARCNKSEKLSDHLIEDNLDYKLSSHNLGSSELLKLLLDHGAEMDLQDNDGLSALMSASKARNIEMVKLLLEHNAQVHLADRNGVTALTHASASESPEIVRLLITHDKKENDTENKDEKFNPLSDHPQPASAIGHTKDLNSHDKKQDQVVITTTSAPAQGEEQKLPLFKTGESQDKHTPPSDNKESSEVNHLLPASPVREKPVTTTDAKLPRSKTEEGDAKDEKKPTLTIPKVFTELKLLASRWYNIGIFLDIEPGTLDTIKTNNPTDVEVCLMCMIREWLNCIKPRPTWEKLVEATKVFNPKKSEDIRLKYCQ